MTSTDKNYCASPNCKNECGRQMSVEIAAIPAILIEAIRDTQRYNVVINSTDESDLISYAYFCGEPAEKK